MSVDVDVLLILEGTYPYIRGGVSTWVHQIITGMPDVKFGGLFIGSREEDYGEIKYQLPKNLVFLERFYLFSKTNLPPLQRRKGSQDVYKLMSFFFDMPSEELSEPSFYEERVSFYDFVYGEETWLMLEELYTQLDLSIPFVDFFWTLRNILSPLWVLVKALRKVEGINIGLLHSPSTGYAGFLGSMIKRATKTPFIITEHGIYTRERKIDIMASKWIRGSGSLFGSDYEIEPLKDMWIKFFVNLGKVCYASADKVFSLFEGARQIQISLGCPEEKTQVIPNGVDIKRYASLRRDHKEGIPPVVALIGRVTPIKDIKTFVKAMGILAKRMPKVEGWIVGPEDEDPLYAQECKALAKALNLEDKVKFLGFRRIEEVMPYVGLTTLTSISEGMPMVVLESFACGLPVVATNVGSCSQLIYGGLNEEDIAIGKAGEVVSVGDVEALAHAYEKILKEKDLWESLRSSAIKRVERFYSMEDFLLNYRKVYESFMGATHGRHINRA